MRQHNPIPAGLSRAVYFLPCVLTHFVGCITEAPFDSSVVVMESVVLRESRRKFWTCSELVDYLLIFLDAKSVFNLCQALNPALRVVQGRNAWNKLLRRACIAPTVDLHNDSSEVFIPCRSTLTDLSEILQLMKDGEPCLLDLLDFVCERFPYFDRDGGGDLVQVSCPRHKDHSLSPAGFLLLEEVESTLESTEQRILSVKFQNLKEPFLSALSSRVSRQLLMTGSEKVDISFENIFCNSEKSAQALATLMKGSHEDVFCQTLKVEKDIKRKGWVAVKEAMSGSMCGRLQLTKIESNKKEMTLASLEDVKAIWTCLSYSWTLWLDGGACETFHKRWDWFKHPGFVNGKLGWKLLEELLTKSEEEWTAKYPDGILVNNIRTTLLGCRTRAKQ